MSDSTDDIFDGDHSSSVNDAIKLNESNAQIAFAKIIVMGALVTFSILTGFALYFISNNDSTKLSILMDFTTKWFSPVWAVIGGVVTYFFPSRKS